MEQRRLLYHLSPSGQAGFVLAKGSLTSKTSGEGDIRKEMVEARLVDCIINLPAKLFLNTQIPACLWFLSRNKANGKFRNRTDILFIDARNLGHLINRRTKEFTAEDIAAISGTYHNFKERFTRLKAEFEAQLEEETQLNALIAENLAKVKL